MSGSAWRVRPWVPQRPEPAPWPDTLAEKPVTSSVQPYRSVPGPTGRPARDPRAKLLALLVLTPPLLREPSPEVVSLYLAVVALALGWSGRARSVLRGLVPIAWLAMGLVVLSALATPADRSWLLGVLPFSPTGALQGSLFALRMLELVLLGALLAATTPPLRLVAGLEWLLTPLHRLGVNVHLLGLTTLLVLRLVPLLRAEIATTERAMWLRGARFGRSPVAQVRRLATLALPTLDRLVGAADDLAIALVSRGYDLRPPHPAPADDLRFGWADAALLAASLVVGAAALAL